MSTKTIHINKIKNKFYNTFTISPYLFLISLISIIVLLLFISVSWISFFYFTATNIWYIIQKEKMLIFNQILLAIVSFLSGIIELI